MSASCLATGQLLEWSQIVPRYLTPIDPGRLPHFFTDVLIIGSGLAGLRAAQEISRDLNVLLITKDVVGESNSTYAQGGIASVWDPEDRFEDHVQDTLQAGGQLCDAEIVDLVVREAPERVRELIQWGTQFDSRNGTIELGREGGHSHQRILHAMGDATGQEIMRAMQARTNQLPNVTLWEKAFTIDLLTDSEGCRGALVWRPQWGRVLVWAKQTILCTGGCGRVYRESTNPPVATGDGHAIAFRAGAELRDMEFMQFHPTVLYIAGAARTLITEAIRGEGAHLIDCHGERFMPHLDPRAELAPRDVVSQAIVSRMAQTDHPCVYLSLKHLDPSFVHQRFPGIARAVDRFGLDLARDPIPVRPGAHYMIGGVSVDWNGQTTLPGLWAAGEVTSSGLHGANRLASNSLLEGLVFGARTGAGASAAARSQPTRYEVRPIPQDQRSASEPLPFDATDILNAIQSLMGRWVGVQRHAENLTKAMDSLTDYSRYVFGQPSADVASWELQNMLTVALLMTAAALNRNESRGVHFRTDFPHTDNQHWQRHIQQQRA
jgi:L-aspartate oxidase